MIDHSEWYWVYPRGDKLDLTDKVEPIAMFQHEQVARAYAARQWPRTGEVHKGGISNSGVPTR